MDIIFRTPAAAYHYEPSLLDHLQSITKALDEFKGLEDAPFGWDVGALELVQYKDGAVIVAPLINKDGHSADVPLVMLPSDWLDTCCFPLILSREVGLC
tara:strand:+ start:1102 stop:1398 length:297 start_codon:yes stop_codon:yes gene_type:complete